MLSILVTTVGFISVLIGYFILHTIEDGSGKITIRIILSSIFVFGGLCVVVFQAVRMLVLYILPRLLDILF